MKMKKLIFLLAVTSAFPAFSGTHAQAGTTPLPGPPTQWAITSIRPTLSYGRYYENPQVTWSNGQYIPNGTPVLDGNGNATGETFLHNTFDVINHGGFLINNLNKGKFPARNPGLDSFTYVYKTTNSVNKTFEVRIVSRYGEDSYPGKTASGQDTIISKVKDGKVGLMLRNSLEPNSPYVMMAYTNENGPEFSSRLMTGGTATATVKANQPRHAVAKLRLTCSGNQVSGDVLYEYEGFTNTNWVNFGTAKFPSGQVWVGFAAAANTYGNSLEGNKDKNGNVYKQYQLGELELFTEK